MVLRDYQLDVYNTETQPSAMPLACPNRDVRLARAVLLIVEGIHILLRYAVDVPNAGVDAPAGRLAADKATVLRNGVNVGFDAVEQLNHLFKLSLAWTAH